MDVYALKNINVEMISLVKAGANQKTIIMKRAEVSPNARSRVIPIKKYDETEGIVYGVVYGPDQVDAHGDCATAEEIKSAAFGFMKSLRNREVDRDHDFQPRPAFICESWLIKAADTDPVFPGEPVGTWCVGIKLEDEELKKAVASGEISGISMAGSADRSLMEKGAVTYNAARAKTGVWELLDALGDSLRSIMEDDEIDKPAMIEQTFNEAKSAFLAGAGDSAAPDNEETPEQEEKLVEKILKRLRTFRKAEGEEGAAGAPPENGTPENPEEDKDLAKIVEDGFAKMDERLTALEGRVQAMEDAGKVSKQDKSPLEKADESAALGAEMAGLVN